MNTGWVFGKAVGLVAMSKTVGGWISEKNSRDRLQITPKHLYKYSGLGPFMDKSATNCAKMVEEKTANTCVLRWSKQ